MDKETVPLCKDCKHFILWNYSLDDCSKFTIQTVHEDVVRGNKTESRMESCRVCRKDETKCGINAKCFEQKLTVMDFIKRFLSLNPN